MNINLDNILFILIIFQLLFLSFFLFTEKSKTISNALLACFFLSICLNLTDVFLLLTGIYFTYPAFAGFGSCLPLLFGPIIFLYTQSVIYKDFELNRKKLFHFLPFLVFFCGTEFYYLMQPADVKQHVLKEILAHHFPAAISVVSTLMLVQFLAYAVLSLRLVSVYKKTASQQFSNPKHTNVSWLYSTIVFFILIMILSTLNGLLTTTPFAKYYLLAFNVIILAVLIYIIRVLMKVLRQSYFFSMASQQDLIEQSSAPAKNNPVAIAEKEEMIRTVLEYMKDNKPYLEPELTLDQLASQLSMKSRSLSQAINDILSQNFFDFINRYRIEEAQHLLTKPEDKKITILEVLYRVGFNSKSSFNTLFKKYTGLTPTEFKKNNA